MRNVWLIAKREYLERIRTKSFRIMTVLIPVVMIGGLVGGGFASGRQKARYDITIVAPERYQQFALDLQTQLEHNRGNRMGVEVVSQTSSTRGELNAELSEKDLDGYLWIAPPAQPGNTLSMTWTPRIAELRLQPFLAGNAEAVLADEGSPSAEPVQVALDLSQSTRSSDNTMAYVTAFSMFFLMYFVIMMYGMNVARSIIEEKTSRIFEVLLATIRPEEMMAGKVIGVGSVGLTQVAIWMFAGIVLAGSPLLTRITGAPVHVPLGAAQIIYFVVFFLLGYLLYSSIAAALGAMTNSEQELQQLNMFLALPLACCMFVLGIVLANPGGPASTIISFIPFCTPLIMFMRIMLHNPPVPWWQIAFSIVDMLVCIWAFLWIASRIYRVGILMYGKKPNLAEIRRWLKYS